jgi:hypothetical protein
MNKYDVDIDPCMSDTDADTNPNADYREDRPRLRKMTTIDLFEMYWVVGMSTNEIVEQTPYKDPTTVSHTLSARKIPVTSIQTSK